MRLINCPKCGIRCSDQCQTCPDCGFDLGTYFEVSKSKQKKHIDKQTLMFLGIAVVVITAIVATVRIKKGFTHASIIQNVATETTESYDEDAETVNEESVSEPSLISQDFNESPADESDGHQQKEADDEKEADNDSVDDSEEKTGEVDVSGVYTGDDHEALVIDSDGMAYYYCIQKQYTDLQCPWYVEDDRVYIALARLHCTIYADINADELIFKSDSINWNPEVFTKVNVSPEEYLTRKLTTYDPKGTLNIDGTITYEMDGISYVVPKTYADFDDYDFLGNDCSVFIDVDAQTDYSASILFYRTSQADQAADDSEMDKVRSFAARFYDDVSIGSFNEINIAGYNAHLYEVSGYQNEGFQNLQSYAVTGYYAIFYNSKASNMNIIAIMQNESRSIDNSEAFKSMLDNAW